MTHISAIMTAHREGLLAGPAISSFDAAIGVARAAGLVVEPLIVIDRGDDLTKSMFLGPNANPDYRVVLNDAGDPGGSRNRGVAEARGEYVSFLDADDMWSANWLGSAYDFCARALRPTIGHSECNIVFGDQRLLWFHADSEAETFDPDLLRIDNYWDAMSFGRRQIFIDFPFAPNNLGRGYGHEDWHWNCVTLAEGIAHRPVPGTLHAKRRRGDTQTARCTQQDVVVWPNKLASYSWRMPMPAIALKGSQEESVPVQAVSDTNVAA